MSKWIAEFELEDGDTMPEYMDYMNQMREYEEELTRELACMNGKITSRVYPSVKGE